MKPENPYTVIFLKTFRREFKNLSGEHKNAVLKKVELLRTEPFYKSLRTKKLNGQDELYESRVNDSIRLIWQFDDEGNILMVDVGQHDVLKNY